MRRMYVVARIAGLRIVFADGRAKSRVKRMVKRVNQISEQTAAPEWMPPYS